MLLLAHVNVHKNTCTFVCTYTRVHTHIHSFFLVGMPEILKGSALPLSSSPTAVEVVASAGECVV